jgi:Tol biopolymer transport system component
LRPDHRIQDDRAVLARISAAIAFLTLAALAAAAPAQAAFPGNNGRIAFQGFRSLASINVGGGDRRPLISESAFFGAPAYSPDGKRIAFSSDRDGNFEIYVMPADGGQPTRLTNTAAEDDSPAWSPDGTHIVFESDRDLPGTTDIYVMGADGSSPVRLTATITEERDPSWSPNGSRIAFARAAPGGIFDVWTMGVDGGSQLQLTTDPNLDERNPDWSPDSARIAFQRQVGSDTQIVTMRPDGTDDHALSGLPATARRPAWAPDGTRIAFDADSEIFSVNPDGSNVTQLTQAGSSTLIAQSPSWQPIPIPGGGVPPPPPPGTPPPGFVDADRDGVAPPFDCRDDDPKIFPGAKDLPRDGIDQDCSGRDERYPLLGRRIEAFLTTFPGPAYTTFTAMTVKPVRAGDVLRLTCKGRGCKVKKKTVRIKKSARGRSMLRYVKGAKLRKGVVVKLRVTRPQTVGRMTIWKIRAPNTALITRRCVRPGVKKPGRCPG